MIFTEEQNTIFQFVENESGHAIIDAVAGAGKTTTIMECAKLVKDRSTILFCAFNSSIASEIAHKFHKLGLNDVNVKTIHALGRQILLDNNDTGLPITLEENKYAVLLKSDDVLKKLRPNYEKIHRINGFRQNQFVDRRKIANDNLSFLIDAKLLEINQKYRSTLSIENFIAFEELIKHFGIFTSIEVKQDHFKEELKCYFECHKILLEAGNELSKRSMIIDFTDMLYLPYIWNLQPAKKFEFLFIDECQDLSKSQFAVVAKYGKKDGRILAVGDPSQSIYGFTGADINSFNRVKNYTQARQLSLTTCFRCPQQVVQLAKEIREDIIGNKEEQGLIHHCFSEEVVNLAKAGDLIISRLRAPIVLLVFSFIDKNIRVHIHRDEVKDIINEIRSIFKQEELNASISKLPKGFLTLRKEVARRWDYIIQKNAKKIKDSAERKLYIINENKYLEQKLEFLHKKYELWKEDCDTINQIVKIIKDYISATSNAIKLSTIHRAKGLENDRVFILNYDELPFTRLNQKDWERTQELNLKYVAITRALKELFLIENKKIEVCESEESLFDNLPFDCNKIIS